MLFWQTKIRLYVKQLSDVIVSLMPLYSKDATTSVVCQMVLWEWLVEFVHPVMHASGSVRCGRTHGGLFVATPPREALHRRAQTIRKSHIRMCHFHLTHVWVQCLWGTMKWAWFIVASMMLVRVELFYLQYHSVRCWLPQLEFHVGSRMDNML